MEDLRALILEEGCGFRPARKGGIRLDIDWVDGKAGRIPVVFNYGYVISLLRKALGIELRYSHGGGGYQSSWGSASIALNLLNQALRKK